MKYFLLPNGPGWWRADDAVTGWLTVSMGTGSAVSISSRKMQNLPWSRMLQMPHRCWCWSASCAACYQQLASLQLTLCVRVCVSGCVCVCCISLLPSASLRACRCWVRVPANGLRLSGFLCHSAASISAASAYIMSSPSSSSSQHPSVGFSSAFWSLSPSAGQNLLSQRWRSCPVWIGSDWCGMI